MENLKMVSRKNSFSSPPVKQAEQVLAASSNNILRGKDFFDWYLIQDQLNIAYQSYLSF